MNTLEQQQHVNSDTEWIEMNKPSKSLLVACSTTRQRGFAFCRGKSFCKNDPAKEDCKDIFYSPFLAIHLAPVVYFSVGK